MPRFHLSSSVRTKGQVRPPRGNPQWLFIIEGDSACANAERGREFLFKYVGGGTSNTTNPWFRTVLTLSGVIRNEARAKRAYLPDDVRNMMSFIERPGNRDTILVDPVPETIARVLEYDKIVIMTDPDADGAHIRGLVLLAITNKHPGLLHHPGFLHTLRVPRFCEEDGGLPHKGLGSLSINAVLRVFLNFERHLEEYVSKTEFCDLNLRRAFGPLHVPWRRWLLVDADAVNAPDGVIGPGGKRDTRKVVLALERYKLKSAVDAAAGAPFVGVRTREALARSRGEAAGRRTVRLAGARQKNYTSYVSQEWKWNA
jgi:Toprim domain